MGVLADAALAEGGEVHGVITRALEEKEIAHQGLTSLQIVETMHERKAAMADKSEAFIMLPGGFGTLDEFFEVVTWTQWGSRQAVRHPQRRRLLRTAAGAVQTGYRTAVPSSRAP